MVSKSPAVLMFILLKVDLGIALGISESNNEGNSLSTVYTPDKMHVFLAVVPEREAGAANRFLIVEGLDGVVCYIVLGKPDRGRASACASLFLTKNLREYRGP